MDDSGFSSSSVDTLYCSLSSLFSHRSQLSISTSDYSSMHEVDEHMDSIINVNLSGSSMVSSLFEESSFHSLISELNSSDSLVGSGLDDSSLHDVCSIISESSWSSDDTLDRAASNVDTSDGNISDAIDSFNKDLGNSIDFNSRTKLGRPPNYILTKQQVLGLEAEFETNQFCPRGRKFTIGENLEIEPSTVLVWFCNTRRRLNRQRCQLTKRCVKEVST